MGCFGYMPTFTSCRLCCPTIIGMYRKSAPTGESPKGTFTNELLTCHGSQICERRAPQKSRNDSAHQRMLRHAVNVFRLFELAQGRGTYRRPSAQSAPQ